MKKNRKILQMPGVDDAGGEDRPDAGAPTSYGAPDVAASPGAPILDRVYTAIDYCLENLDTGEDEIRQNLEAARADLERLREGEIPPSDGPSVESDDQNKRAFYDNRRLVKLTDRFIERPADFMQAIAAADAIRRLFNDVEMSWIRGRRHQSAVVGMLKEKVINPHRPDGKPVLVGAIVPAAMAYNLQTAFGRLELTYKRKDGKGDDHGQTEGSESAAAGNPETADSE